MLRVQLQNNVLRIGDHCQVRFMRTLRIPDDGRDYPLPPGLGTFPVLSVDRYAEHVPDSWREHGGVFIPMYQREALWLDFTGSSWTPHALKIGVGNVNAVSGAAWDASLDSDPQDYVVVPDQPWLDGINAGAGFIRQFVAMPLGMGYTVESQVTGTETVGGIQLLAFAPKPGRFTHEPQTPDLCCSLDSSAEMGLGAGGRMRQSIYPDPYGTDTWDQQNTGRVFVHLVNSMMFRDITGQEPPPTPINARSYTQAGLPWFDLYDHDKGDLEASPVLAGVKTVKDIDLGHGFSSQQDDEPVDIPQAQRASIGADPNEIREGAW